MKVVVAVSGQIREFHKQLKEALAPLSPTYVLATWDAPSSEDFIAEFQPVKSLLIKPNLFKLKYLFLREYRKLVPDDVYRGREEYIINGRTSVRRRTGKTRHVTVDNAFRMFYLMHKSASLVRQLDFKPDVIIKVRPDSVVLPVVRPEDIVVPEGVIVNISGGIGKNVLNPVPGGMSSDRFFYGNADDMFSALDVWSNLPKLAATTIDPATVSIVGYIHPETTLNYHILDKGLTYTYKKHMREILVRNIKGREISRLCSNMV